MKKSTVRILNEFYTDFPIMKNISGEIESAVRLLLEAYENGNKLLVCGNGGSAADSEHIVGELMKGFRLKRPLPEQLRKELEEKYQSGHLADYLEGALPAISLTAHTAFATAFHNDVASETVFAQQVLGYGKTGDILLGITTSGNSANVVNAARVARVIGVRTIGLTGEGGGQMKELCDVTIAVPETEVYRVQQLHLPVYHALCAAVENENFGDSD